MKKQFKFYAYEIVSGNVGSSSLRFVELLLAKLRPEITIVKDRCMPIYGSRDELLLSDFSTQTEKLLVLGTLFRMTTADTINNVPLQCFNAAKISEKDLLPLGDSDELVTKHIHYFIVGKKYFITDIPNSRIGTVQKYFNWLLDLAGEDQIFLRSKIDVSDIIQLKNISKIIFSENLSTSNSSKSNKTVWQTLGTLMHDMISDVQPLDVIRERNLLNAKVEINFKDIKKKVEDDKLDAALATIITPTTADNILLVLKDKRKMSAGSLLWYREFVAEYENVTELSHMVNQKLLSVFNELAVQ